MKNTYELWKFPRLKVIFHHHKILLYVTVNELSSDNNQAAVCYDKYG